MSPAPLFRKSLPYLLAALSLVCVGLLSYLKAFEAYELQTYDWRCQRRGPRPVSDRIVMIDISNDTVQRLGAWPFDREFHSNVIDYLSACGAKAIIFDIGFSDRKDTETDKLRSDYLDVDAEVVKSAKQAGNVYFPIAYTLPRYDGKIYSATGFEMPLITAYRKAAKGVGFVNVIADLDGKRRKAFPIIRYRDRDFFQLSIKVAADLLGVSRDQIVLEPNKCLRLGKAVRIPLDEEGCMIVNYASIWQAPTDFKHLSYLDVIQSYAITRGEKRRVEPGQLKDKLCIIGLTSAGSTDSNAMPLQSVYPMVGIHANILNNILLKDFIYRAGRLWNLAILLLLATLVILLSVRLKPLRAFLAMTAVVLLFVGAAVLVFNRWGLWIDLFYPVILLPALYTITILLKIIGEIRKRQLIENELAVASQIQKSFLPEKAPAHEGLQVEVFMKPAKAIGGDLYAFIPLKDGSLGVMVGDVSGKGTPAALFMAKVVSEFKFFAKDQNNPAEVLSKLNDAISAESTSGLFVTVCYAIFDTRLGRMVMSNGGHLPIVRTASGKPAELLSAEAGMPIGVMEGVEFANFEVTLADGDALAFYSDGVSEGRNKKQEEFGVETLQGLIDRYRTGNAKQILDATVGDLTRFIGKAEQHDDITLIVVKVASAKETPA